MLRAEMLGMVVVVSLLVACGGGSEGGDNNKGDGGGGSGGGTSKIDACQLVTQSDATSLFGQTATKYEGAPTVDPNIATCDWDYNYSDNSSQLLQFLIYNDAVAYSEPPDAAPFAIGEKGYIALGSVTGVDIGWVQDNKTFMLSYSTVGSSAPEATTKADAVKALAKKVEGAL